ncbi:MAG: hypothetical protein WD738_08325 [Pirellulales bacterium]
MRPLCILLLSLLAIAAADAQAPYSAGAPQPAWGGHALPAQVPYQPTLPGDSPSQSPVITYEWPPSETSAEQVWQPYPAAQEPFSVGGVPVAAPGFAMQEPIYPPTPEPSLRESLIPPDARNGFFQKAKFTATWMPQLANDSLGWTDLRSEVVTALPFFTRENPIIITPSYELHFLERPEGFDLPPRLHDLAIDFHVFRVFGNHWIADFALTPGLYGDDNSLDASDALRVNGRAVAVYAPTLDWKWVLGVTYVDGGWAKIVPIVGVVYEPNDDVKYELVFPRPRVAWRLPNSPVPGRDEYWFYVLGEFGNSIWAFQQTDGTPDVLASRDFRFILGLERKIVGGISYKAEIGYVFNRDIKVASVSGDDIGLDDTFLMRAGVAY